MLFLSSAIAPASSTPVGPPPTITKFNKASRSLLLLVTAALSKF